MVASKNTFFNVKRFTRKNRIFGPFPLLLYINCNPALPSLCEASHNDGWGESFEQHEIKVPEGELYVHLWNSENRSIETEQEQFGTRIAEGLPKLCFSVLPGQGDLIAIKRGESGYCPSDWSTDDRQRNEELADQMNERLGVTPAQRQAMETGSMFGWAVPGADPKVWEQKGPEMGGMRLG